ncbi:hypothetical protein SAMN05444972_11266 [Marininema halotolerans]|uniref:Uncharacterized protein n=1 Tax=Marininema halotolerans TaxID=1155944 RepID=A0A1I6TZY1_9BACL|nr:hypothetical protein SAMN05444972_11266 [Marininema halotolerans]
MLKKTIFCTICTFGLFLCSLLIVSGAFAQVLFYTFDCYFDDSASPLGPNRSLNGDTVQSLTVEMDQEPSYFNGLSVCLTDENEKSLSCKRLLNGESAISYELEKGTKYKVKLYNFTSQNELHLTGKVIPSYR